MLKCWCLIWRVDLMPDAGWSLRQYTFGANIVGAAPEAKDFGDDSQRAHIADRADRVMGG